ncbi:tRNA (adenosine(37)-N6)-dimethylallyltransferase MiaA, partial [bacterium]|nr:tRNA (adenosine(37)-N6)-dimethylallyltransferase MiaA [bacterium]
CRMDPEAADKINKNDELRIIRSLEILFLTGRKPSVLYNDHAFAHERYKARILCVMPERERLYQDIDARVEAMIAAGLVGETENLISLGFGRDLRSMQTLAYKHVISFLDAAISLDEAEVLIRRDTRRYAKRQITWMRSHYDASCFHTPAEASLILSAWLREDSN